MNYAKQTTVSIDRSQQELSRLLRRAGADKCMQGWDGSMFFVAFILEGIPIRMKIEMPARHDFTRTETGRSRKHNAAIAAWEQACRQTMREFCLLLKAKLVAVSKKVRPLQHEFYSDICLPAKGGSTIYECQNEELQKIITTGKLPTLLPGV